MAGLTRVYAYRNFEDAKNAAKDLLNDGQEVAITGKTSVVQLKGPDDKYIYWSESDPSDVYIIIASQDGVQELHLKTSF